MSSCSKGREPAQRVISGPPKPGCPAGLRKKTGWRYRLGGASQAAGTSLQACALLLASGVREQGPTMAPVVTLFRDARLAVEDVRLLAPGLWRGPLEHSKRSAE